jgi:hypothetical protein
MLFWIDPVDRNLMTRDQLMGIQVKRTSVSAHCSSSLIRSFDSVPEGSYATFIAEKLRSNYLLLFSKLRLCLFFATQLFEENELWSLLRCRVLLTQCVSEPVFLFKSWHDAWCACVRTLFKIVRASGLRIPRRDGSGAFLPVNEWFWHWVTQLDNNLAALILFRRRLVLGYSHGLLKSFEQSLWSFLLG